MGRKLILKTILICLGIFIMISTGVVYYVLNTFEFETERRVKVLVASRNIDAGEILNESLLSYKTIKESGSNEYMAKDIQKVIGQKLLTKANSGDYIRSYDLLPKNKWYKDEQKIIVVPMDIENRLANLIKKGSSVDIKVELNNSKSIPLIVLSKLNIEDILDENGISVGNDIGNKKTFAKLILNKSQRDKLYIAKSLGKLIFELYCDTTQKPSQEEFKIPAEYLNVTTSDTLQDSAKDTTLAASNNTIISTSMPAKSTANSPKGIVACRE